MASQEHDRPPDGPGDKDSIPESDLMPPIQEEECKDLEHIPSNRPVIGPADAAMKDSTTINSNTFKRWLKTVRKNRRPKYKGPYRYVYGWPEDEAQDASYTITRNRGSVKTDTSSVASSAVYHAVGTASISGTSLSNSTRPRSNTVNSTQQSGFHGSGPSGSDPRTSTDSNKLTTTLSLDEGAWNRAVKRRQIIGEIVDTEIMYVASIKALSDVLSTMVVTRSGLHRSADDILSLHETFLLGLRRLTASSRPDTTFSVKSWAPKRERSRKNSLVPRPGSVDRKAIASRKLREPIDARIKASRMIAAEPHEAAEIAQLVFKMLPRFSAYREYGLKYQLAIKEIEMFRKSLANSESMELGIEALVKSTVPPGVRHLFGKQGLTLADLLMKPIQRICRYQLFLADLLKSTPVADCPISHETVDRVLQSVIEMVQSINRGTGDPLARDRLEKTILLQDKIEFANEPGGTREILQDFGPLRVCGVLHVAYETKETVKGDYMMCALFATHLLLTTLREESRKFAVVAVIHTSDIELKSADDGTGLHCEGADHTWKLIFSTQKDIFELVMTACSEKEYSQWKEQLVSQRTEGGRPTTTRTSSLPRSSTLLNLKPKLSLAVEGRRPNVERRCSANSVPQLNSESVRIDLIIKGTEATPRAGHDSPKLGRSRSLQTNRQIAILTPKRQDRMRMERRLSGIWTRDIIPYPGMHTGRGELMIRSGAESLFRKLSRRKPFKRQGSGSSSIPSKKRSTEAVTVSNVDHVFGDKEHAFHAAVTQTREGDEDKDSFNTSGGDSPHSVRFAESCKGYLMLPDAEDGRLRENKPGIRKRLSLSLFKGLPAHSTASRAVPMAF